MSSQPTSSRRRMLFGEKIFGIFFVVWGLFLQLDNFVSLSPYGVFLFELKCYAPTWLWGAALTSIGLGRYFAYKSHSARWRLTFSSASIILLWIIAAVALWSRLLGATFPLAAFVAVLAQQFHRMLARDIELGL